MRPRHVGLAAALAVVAAGCAIDKDSAPRNVPDDRREELRAPPQQLAPGGSSGDDRIFLVVSDTGRLRTSQRETDGSPQELMESLFEGATAEDQDNGLRSVLDPFEFRSATVQDNVVTVDVDVDPRVLSGSELRLAVAQIVYTASQLLPDATAEVVIKLDGGNSEWPDGAGNQTGEPLTIFDFYPLAESAQPAYPSRPSRAPAPTTTTTSSVPPSTPSSPPASDAADSTDAA
ncbi:GerMN domain-containing protein [Desertimonas flava]|uniref:GerMN domain-containing protein n=1 Tax=Desertimonas flava TaxID=2064846 RepID=UPI000E34A57B|nr:GerMN domain-containing protein [Desertimonas flava]